jgi:hypothetical protein
LKWIKSGDDTGKKLIPETMRTLSEIEDNNATSHNVQITILQLNIVLLDCGTDKNTKGILKL